MIVPGTVMFEPLPALPALVRPLPGVDPHVGDHLVPLPEPPPALLTLKRLLSCMDPLVTPELLIIQELLPTETAGFLVLLPVMSLLVTVSHALLVEPLPTLGAHELLSVVVRLHVALVGFFPVEVFVTYFTLEGV